MTATVVFLFPKTAFASRRTDAMCRQFHKSIYSDDLCSFIDANRIGSTYIAVPSPRIASDAFRARDDLCYLLTIRIDSRGGYGRCAVCR